MHGIPPMSTFYNDLAGAPKFTLLPCLLLFLRAVGENQGQEGKFAPDFVPNYGLMGFRKCLLFNIFSKKNDRFSYTAVLSCRISIQIL